MFNIFIYFVAYLHIKIKLGYAIQDADIMKKKCTTSKVWAKCLWIYINIGIFKKITNKRNSMFLKFLTVKFHSQKNFLADFNM